MAKFLPPRKHHLSFPGTFKKEKASKGIGLLNQMNKKKREASTTEQRGLRQAFYH